MKNTLLAALLAATSGGALLAWLTLTHFESPSLLSALLEGMLVLVTGIILWHLQRFPVEAHFYKYLVSGFLLLYLSLFIDLLDEFFFQPNWLAFVEEASLLAGFLLATYGVYLGTQHHYEQIQRLEELAATDSLTGLLNRRAMINHLEHQARLSQQDPSQTFSVIMVDIDRFKSINDRLGHDAGDTVLRHIASQLRGGLRASDRIGRWGGEEFVILLPQTLESGAALVAEKIRQHIVGKPFITNGQSVELSISLGVAQWQPAYTSWGDVIKQADLAMYLAKKSGRNRVRTGSQLSHPVPDSLLPDSI